MLPGRRVVQGIVTVVESESSKPRHARERYPAGDSNERLAFVSERETERGYSLSFVPVPYVPS
jgi:hypothetical protein